jgi:hypothetical protein
VSAVVSQSDDVIERCHAWVVLDTTNRLASTHRALSVLPFVERIERDARVVRLWRFLYAHAVSVAARIPAVSFLALFILSVVRSFAATVRAVSSRLIL